MALDPQDRDAIVDAISAGFTKASSSRPQPSSNNNDNPIPKVGAHLEKATAGFGRVLDQGGGSLTSAAKDFSSMLPSVLSSVGSAGTSIIKTLEDSQTVFQNMAKVGGGLGGDLGGAIKGFKKAITDEKPEETGDPKRVDDENSVAKSAETKSTEAPVEKTQTENKQ